MGLPHNFQVPKFRLMWRRGERARDARSGDATLDREGLPLRPASSMSCTATIAWFNAKKGFGFAAPESGSDLFVHISNVVKVDGVTPQLDDGDIIYCARASKRLGRLCLAARVTVCDCSRMPR